MGTKRVAAKRSAKKSLTRAVNIDIAKITASSVRARLGKKLPSEGGILAGIIVRPEEVEALGKTPLALAREITKDVSAQTGIRLTPKVFKGDGGILMGFLPPVLILDQDR